MDAFSVRAVQAAYDAVASDYVRAFADDLTKLPIDRAMLDAAAETLPPGGLTLDLGCGPGAAGIYLSDRGTPAIGADLSAGMLAAARDRGLLRVVQADMRHLPFRSSSLALVVAYYSIQHVPRVDISIALDEIARVLLPGEGVLLLATHLGSGDVYSNEFLGHEIDAVGGALYEHQEIIGHLRAAGFAIETTQQRDPLPHEHDSRRIYLLARTSSSLAY